MMDRREVIKQIITQCKHDAENLDGRPFTGREVATVFGETLANIYALAKVVEDMIEGEK